MTVTTTRISADEFLAGDYPTGSELVDGVVHLNDATFPHHRVCKRVDMAFDPLDGGFGPRRGRARRELGPRRRPRLQARRVVDRDAP